MNKSEQVPFMNKSSQSGQIVIILLLITLVALSVGLAITQRSLTNITTSTQNEQASRAFSAADAGIERAIQQDQALTSFAVGTDSTASVTKTSLPNSQQALEYPPIGKETVAQFWLVNPDNPISDNTYLNNTVDIYFGRADILTTSPDSPAIEISAIVYDTTSSSYSSLRTYVDSSSSAGRSPGNGFILTTNGCTGSHFINTSSSADTTTLDRNFRCRHNIDLRGGNTNLRPIMVRIRILYSSLNHPIAVKPTTGNSLPQQANVFVSRGVAGQSQKTLQVFRLKYVVPQFFDFSIFSGGDITKTSN